MRKSVLSVLVLAVLVSGCYRATVDTGRPPSGQVVERDWAHGFVYGLVPPSTVETAAQCPNGVAKVETQLSFLNQLATFLTWGLYTPMTIQVQCAAAGVALSTPAGADVISSGSDRVELGEALNEAMERAVESREAVYVQFSTVE